MLIVKFEVVCKHCSTMFQVIVGKPVSIDDLKQAECPKCKSSNYTVPKRIMEELFPK